MSSNLHIGDRGAAGSRPRLSAAFTGALLAVCVYGAVAAAQDAADPNRLSRAWLEAAELQDDVLAPEQQAQLLQLAYHAAAASVCDQLALDEASFVAAFEQIQHPQQATMSDAERQQYERYLSVHYGIAVGIFLAEASPQADVFCSEALAYKSEADASHLWR